MNFPFPIIPIIFFIICGVTALVYWYKMISIMESKGMEINSNFMNPWYYSLFGEIIKKEIDPKLKRKYRFILYIQLLIIPLYFVGILVLFEIF